MNITAITGRLIDGVSDRAVEKGAVLFEDDEIVYAGSAESCQIPSGARVIDAKDGTILPGFIDCHTHMAGDENGLRKGRTQFDDILSASHHLGLLLDAGFTFIRDMSLFSGALKRAVDRREVRGPDIMPGGRVLSPIAGHVDMHPNLPVEVARQLDTVGYLADGVNGCLEAVRLQFRDGAEFIKICATGGVSSPTDGLEDVQFSNEEITVMCQEAARHGTYVAAHCSNATGAYQALQCGVMCIEHGIDLDERCIALMQEKGVPLITTLFVSNLVATSSDFPDFMREKGRQAAEKHTRSMMKAKEAGIRIAYGTDFSNSNHTPFLGNGMEFRAIVNAGFSPMEAIQIGTINGAHVVRRADRIGSLVKGKQADIVIVDGNPLEDIGVLAHADHVKAVIKKGEIVKLLP